MAGTRLRQRYHLLRPYLLSAAAGGLASLSLPPLYLSPAILLLGFVFYQAAHASGWRQAVCHMAAGGYGWFVISLYWISHSLLIGTQDYLFLLPVSFLGIPVIVTIFWAVGGLAGFMIATHPAARLVAFVAGLSLAEWGREFIATGFPWNAPGLIFLATQPTSQLASLFGQTGLNIWAFALAAVIPFYLSVPKRQRHKVVMAAILCGATFGALVVYATQPAPVTADNAATVRLVQPHIPQAEKWDRSARATHLAHMAKLSLAPAQVPVDLVIWPESAFAGDYSRAQDLLADLAGQIRAHHQAEGGAGGLIMGSLRIDDTDQIKNTALYFEGAGSPHLYDKTHLVPFGEYVPWRVIPFIDAIAGPHDFTPGEAVTPFSIADIGQVQVLICYEAIFPALTGRATKRPDLLVNLTNDAWFGHTAGPYQHLAQTRMTAISYGVPLLRVANTGISAAFDATGQQLAAIPLGQTDFVDLRLPPPLPAPFFARFGALLAGFMVAALLIGAVLLDRLPQNRQ